MDEDSGAWKLLNSMQGEKDLSDLVDVLDGRTATPQETRDYIDKAESEGVAERVEEEEEGGVRYAMYGSLEPEVVRRDGEYTCRRCSRGLSTGHFVRFGDDTEEGPYGSDCVRKILGRE